MGSSRLTTSFSGLKIRLLKRNPESFSVVVNNLNTSVTAEPMLGRVPQQGRGLGTHASPKRGRYNTCVTFQNL